MIKNPGWARKKSRAEMCHLSDTAKEVGWADLGVSIDWRPDCSVCLFVDSEGIISGKGVQWVLRCMHYLHTMFSISAIHVIGIMEWVHRHCIRAIKAENVGLVTAAEYRQKITLRHADDLLLFLQEFHS